MQLIVLVYMAGPEQYLYGFLKIIKKPRYTRCDLDDVALGSSAVFSGWRNGLNEYLQEY